MGAGTKIFIAWSKETEAHAVALRDALQARGLSVWLSDQIEPGRRFREEIRKSVLGAHVVVAVFPASPSPWQIAEAGLAYFENKLIPVAIDSTRVIEPFRELETHSLNSAEIEAGTGPSLDHLEEILRTRLGEREEDRLQFGFFRQSNLLFFYGVPFAGVAVMLIVFFFGLAEPGTFHAAEFWRAVHTAFGAIVYGGGCFVALFFARAGTSTSFAERRFGFVAGKRLFALWFLVAVIQFVLGLTFWFKLGYDPSRQHWLMASALIYPVALLFWGSGYVLYSAAYRLDREQAPLREVQRTIFLANTCFGSGIALITLIILMMSLKGTSMEFLQWAAHGGGQ